MATDDIDFRPSDLVTSAGSANNGEKLIATLTDYYPAELQAAQLKRINPRLDEQIDDDFRGKLASLVGVGHIEQAHVRGGERRDDDAVVTYAYLDDRETVVKGLLPWNSFQAGGRDGHVSQRESVSASAIAQAHIAERPRDPEPASAAPADPFVLGEMSAEELQNLMREQPERADAVKAFEKAYRGDRARGEVLNFDPASRDDSEDESGDDGSPLPGPESEPISERAPKPEPTEPEDALAPPPAASRPAGPSPGRPPGPTSGRGRGRAGKPHA